MMMVTISKVCVALAGLLAAVSAIPVPSRVPVEFCRDDCCKPGFVCCTDTCVRFNPNTPIKCPLSTTGGCCGDPDNDCAAEIAPPVDDTPYDDSECCEDDEECCSGSCVPKEELAPGAGGLQRICFSKRGCCPPPPPSDECAANCCQPGLDCICGKCSVFNGLPVLCAADSGSCCTDPENPCATDV